VDAAGLAVFRVLFGAIGLFASVRFVAQGWVERAFIEPTFFFHYLGFEWVTVLPGWAMYGAFGLLALTSLCIGLGLFYRASIITYFLTFTYVELIDVTNYLNHYYLVSLLAFLMIWMPLGRVWGLDGRRRPERALETVPAWMLSLLKYQVAVVYVYAAIAKLGVDWLIHNQPLGLWLAARTDVPVLGLLFAQDWAPWAMSWGGFLFDALIISAMLYRRTRPLAYVVALGFHGAVGLLFHIGMFPWIMIAVLTLFFEPEWPRRFIRSLGEPPKMPSVDLESWSWRGKLTVVAVVLFALFQGLWPARAFLYGGDVLWHEQGMRFSWKVMVREKSGAITYRVTSDRWSSERQLGVSSYLTDYQEWEMAGQPDLILQLAHHIASDLRERGHGDVEIRCDALVAFNGRRMAPLLDPSVDLTHITDSLAPASWIAMAPQDAPIKLRAPKRFAHQVPAQ
jgi:vitamin K-dependent gamma-carboxylase